MLGDGDTRHIPTHDSRFPLHVEPTQIWAPMATEFFWFDDTLYQVTDVQKAQAITTRKCNMVLMTKEEDWIDKRTDG